MTCLTVCAFEIIATMAMLLGKIRYSIRHGIRPRFAWRPSTLATQIRYTVKLTSPNLAVHFLTPPQSALSMGNPYQREIASKMMVEVAITSF